jgi:hypothetical protein
MNFNETKENSEHWQALFGKQTKILKYIILQVKKHNQLFFYKKNEKQSQSS